MDSERIENQKAESIDTEGQEMMSVLAIIVVTNLTRLPTFVMLGTSESGTSALRRLVAAAR